MASPGSSGPVVVLQMPCSSRVMACCVPGVIQSPNRLTSDALGARTRKVTRRSGCTSGETRGSIRCPCANTTAEVRRRNLMNDFMVHSIHRESPAPISRKASACSHTTVSIPTRRNAIAADRPPMPPPMMTPFIDRCACSPNGDTEAQTCPPVFRSARVLPFSRKLVERGLGQFAIKRHHAVVKHQRFATFQLHLRGRDDAGVDHPNVRMIVPQRRRILGMVQHSGANLFAVGECLFTRIPARVRPVALRFEVARRGKPRWTCR